MYLDIAQITEIGQRQTNQDALASALEDDLACFVVADGTGGHEGGEIAANLVSQGIIEKFIQEASFSPRALRSYVEWAILKLAQKKRSNLKQGNLKHGSMSTTMATVLIDQTNRCALWAHLGDTRIYLFRQGKIKIISKDHSHAQRMVDAGYADYAKIRQHPQRSMLFAAIGAEGDILPEVTTDPMTLQNGDAFLLCTDGFWEWVHEQDMERSLSNAKSSDDWLSNMNAIAEKNISVTDVGRDNFSAFAICVRDVATKN